LNFFECITTISFLYCGIKYVRSTLSKEELIQKLRSIEEFQTGKAELPLFLIKELKYIMVENSIDLTMSGRFDWSFDGVDWPSDVSRCQGKKG